MFCERCRSSIRDGSIETVSKSPSISSEELQSLLRTEHPSLSTHASEIPDIVTGIDADIYRYDAQIRQLHSQITLLENKRKRAMRQRERYESLLAPVRRLPSELLNYIFHIYGCSLKNMISPYNLSLPGLTLMSVCARWRGIAVSCTALWTNISVHTENDVARNTALVKPLKWCLECAGLTSPLDIELHATVWDDEEDEEPDEPEVVTLLVSQASRWRHIHLQTEWSLSSFPSLRLLPQKDLGLLQSLSFQYGDSDSLVELPLFRTTGPKLRNLALDGGLSQHNILDLEVFPQLSQINSLTVNYRNDGLQAFPSIEALLAIQALSYTFQWDMEIHSVELPPQQSKTVSSLEIHIKAVRMQPYILDALLSSAEFPTLDRLSVFFETELPWEVDEPGDFTWPKRKLTEFLVRSSSLTFLHIEDAAISSTDLVSLLMETHMLRHFVLYQKLKRRVSDKKTAKTEANKKPTLSMEFIRRLHALGGSEDLYGSHNALVPKLQHLSLKVLSDWFDDDQLFVDVVCSRWILEPQAAEEIGVECLKSVELKVWGRPLDQKVYEPLMQLDRQGMRVEVFGS